MGYYSDVTIICEEKAYELFKEAWEHWDIRPDCVKKSYDDYIIQWDYVKWYPSFNDVKAIEGVCIKLCGEEYENTEGYAFKKLIIGEDNASDEEANKRGWDIMDYYIHCYVAIPDDAKEIEF